MITKPIKLINKILHKKLFLVVAYSGAFLFSFFEFLLTNHHMELSDYIVPGDNDISNTYPITDDPDMPPAGYLSKKRDLNQLSSVDISNSNFDNFFLGTSYAEPHISQNPNNPLQYFVAYNYDAAFYTNNGYDWTATEPDFGEGITPTADPVTAYDDNGNLYFQLLYFDESDYGSRIMRSTDNGATWSSSVHSGEGSDKNWVTVDQTGGTYNGRLYSSIINSDFNGIVLTRSTDLGVTWDTVKSIIQGNVFAGTMFAVGPNGAADGEAVYLATNYGDVFEPTYDFYLSTDGGDTWVLKSSHTGWVGYAGTELGGTHSINGTRTRPVPYIAADNSNGTYRGRLYLVYTTNNPAGDGNKPDIYFRYSDDQAATWSNAKIVNDDVNSQNNFNWFPYVYCDAQTGRILITWLDSRDDPTSDSANVYATYSDDGGQTFQPNARLSNKSMVIFCSTCGGSGTPQYQGDYNSVVSLDGQGMAAWTYFNSEDEKFDSYVSYFPDYALALSNTTPEVYQTNDEVDVYVKIPSVKLYSDEITFSYAISPGLPGGLTIDFPDGNTLDAFPDSVKLRIKTTSTPVTTGDYIITVSGTGPNGTPVHKRTTTLTVQSTVPVELTSFNGDFSNNVVNLNWVTATEVNNYGFNVERKINDESWQKITFINGHGNSNSPKNYSYTDSDTKVSGNYYYRLKQIDNDGTFKYSKEILITSDLPEVFTLYQNYPNPFNPTTTIKYTIPQNDRVVIKIYNTAGQEISTLLNETQNAGTYSVQFDASTLPSGVYFYNMQSGSFSETKKMVVLK